MNTNVPEPHALPAVFLLGATATGKTALTLALAERYPIEIISVDSGQVYRGFDIGTAKPSLAERAAVPHHLIDIRDANEPYTAACFCTAAASLIDEIRRRGCLPVLAGGSMLYFQALEQGLAPLPPADPDVRRQIADEATREGWPALHATLARVDPTAAARIQPTDPQRLQRALEVFRLTGTPLSKLQRQRVCLLHDRPLKFVLRPQSRAWLHARIDVRFDAMLAAGLLDEARQLQALPGMRDDLPAMRSVGYRQALEHLTGLITHDAFVERGKAATRQLAKRQLTWLRGMHGMHELPCSDQQPKLGLGLMQTHLDQALRSQSRQ